MNPAFVDLTLDHVNVSQNYKIRLSSKKKTDPKKGKKMKTNEPFKLGAIHFKRDQNTSTKYRPYLVGFCCQKQKKSLSHLGNLSN